MKRHLPGIDCDHCRMLIIEAWRIPGEAELRFCSEECVNEFLARRRAWLETESALLSADMHINYD